jgi:hypothetical protein
MPKYEKPQKGNRYRLTVKQHFLPLKSIVRCLGVLCGAMIGLFFDYIGKANPQEGLGLSAGSASRLQHLRRIHVPR